MVLEFADGTKQKFDDLDGHTGIFMGTGSHSGKSIVGVWVKSGCNNSGDGPGYGERLDNPGDGSVVHGAIPIKKCKPYVTATFLSSSVSTSSQHQGGSDYDKNTCYQNNSHN